MLLSPPLAVTWTVSGAMREGGTKGLEGGVHREETGPSVGKEACTQAPPTTSMQSSLSTRRAIAPNTPGTLPVTLRAVHVEPFPPTFSVGTRIDPDERERGGRRREGERSCTQHYRTLATHHTTQPGQCHTRRSGRLGTDLDSCLGRQPIRFHAKSGTIRRGISTSTKSPSA
jgi:hypothetical protein